MRSPHTWPLPFLSFPSSAPLRCPCRRWRKLCPQGHLSWIWQQEWLTGHSDSFPRHAKLTLCFIGCREVGSPVPGFPRKAWEEQEEQGECSALLDTSSPPLVQGGGGGELESKEQAGLEGLRAVTAIVCAVLKLPGCWLCMLTPSRVCMYTFRCSMHRQVRLRGQMLRIWLFF